MAHPRLSRVAGALAVASALSASTLGCGGASQVGAASVPSGGGAADAPPWPDEPTRWSAVHSVRFRLSLLLPDARTWSIDDTSHPELVATQASTLTTVEVRTEIEPGLMNHTKCEERARDLGLFPDVTRAKELRSVEDTVTVGPVAYDTHLRVAVEPTTEGRPIRGHVLAAGAYVRKCLFVHVETEIPSSAAEPVLSARLALARVRILGGLQFDEFGSVERQPLDPR